MEEKPVEPVPVVETPVPISPKPPSRFPLWNVLIVLLALLVFVASVLIAYRLGAQQKSSTLIPASSTFPAATPPTTTTPKSAPKRIVYGKDNALYVINADGSSKTKIVSEEDVHKKDWSGGTAGIKGSFIDIAWKNSNEVSYVFCTSSCAIFTTNLTANSTVIEQDPNGETGPARISTFRWSHDATKLAYIFTDNSSGGNMQLALGSKDKITVIKAFAAPVGGRGGSLDDNVSIYFSSNDKYVLVTNTFLQPNSPDKNTIWVFESGGKEIMTIAGGKIWATQARWITGNSFIYKMGDSLFFRDVTENKSEPLQFIKFKNNCYNSFPIFEATRGIFCWTNTSPLPVLIGLDTELKLEGFYKAEKLDDNHLIALKAGKVAAGQEFMSPFISVGLSIIEINTQKETNLDSGEINLFSVSP